MSQKFLSTSHVWILRKAGTTAGVLNNASEQKAMQGHYHQKLNMSCFTLLGSCKNNPNSQANGIVGFFYIFFNFIYRHDFITLLSYLTVAPKRLLIAWICKFIQPQGCWLKTSCYTKCFDDVLVAPESSTYLTYWKELQFHCADHK